MFWRATITPDGGKFTVVDECQLLSTRSHGLVLDSFSVEVFGFAVDEVFGELVGEPPGEVVGGAAGEGCDDGGVAVIGVHDRARAVRIVCNP